MNNFFTFTILLGLIESSVSYFITVDAHGEECFYDRVHAGRRMGFNFQVVEGGFLDIDVRIVGPDEKILYQGDKESSGKFTFSAPLEGKYTYCFSNQMSTMTPKMVMFRMIFDEDLEEGKKTDESEQVDSSSLEGMIKTLSETLLGIKHEQEYMLVRDKVHRSINESTNSRVVMWSFFEACLLVAMTFGQVYYLKRFFEVRRVV